MQLPAISSLVSLLSGSITGLKDLVTKATSLIAAAYFALLHLVLVFPPLRDSGFLPIVAFERLPTVWQVVLGTFIFFTLAYVLTVMAQSFLNLVNGQALQDRVPVLPARLRRGQVARFKQLWTTIVEEADNNENWEAENAADRLAYEFPDEERDIAPTRLGNILLSPASYTYRQYGARLNTIWPILERKVNEELRKQITGEMEAITFLATMSILSVLIALEMVLVVVWFGDSWWSLLWCPVLLLVALVFYYVTFPKARAWGLGIRTAFDQHLDLAADELGLMKLTDPEEKQQRWRDVSAWLSIGALRKPSPGMTIKTPPPEAPLRAQGTNWYKAPAAAAEPLSVKHPPNVTVSAHSEVVATWPNIPLPNGGWQLAGREIIYVIAVTNEGKKPVKGTSLRVMDTRLPVLPVKVFGDIGSTGGSMPEGLPLPADLDSPQSLLWLLPPIAAGETKVLRYRIRFDCSIRIGPGAVVSETEPDCFLLRPTGPNSDIYAFAIVVMNRNQVGSLYDTAANRLNPYWREIDSRSQVVEAAAFPARGEIQIYWNGKQFVTGE